MCSNAQQSETIIIEMIETMTLYARPRLRKHVWLYTKAHREISVVSSDHDKDRAHLVRVGKEGHRKSEGESGPMTDVL